MNTAEYCIMIEVCFRERERESIKMGKPMNTAEY